MLPLLQGKRARVTIAKTGEVIPIRIVNASQSEAVAVFELNGGTPPSGTFIVESFSKESHIIFPAKVSSNSPCQTIAICLAGNAIQSPTNCELALLTEKLAVEFSFEFKKMRTFAIAGGQHGMAILLDKEIPAQSKLKVTIVEDGHAIETEGYVTHIIPRGKGFLAIYRFSSLPRVTMMYWSRILKAS